MAGWQAASLIFFVYAAATAFAVPDVGAVRRRRAFEAALLGLGLLALTGLVRSRPVLTTWVFPPVLLLAGYWTSGFLFAAPMPGAERVLASFDRAVGVHRAAGWVPRAAA